MELYYNEPTHVPNYKKTIYRKNQRNFPLHFHLETPQNLVDCFPLFSKKTSRPKSNHILTLIWYLFYTHLKNTSIFKKL